MTYQDLDKNIFNFNNSRDRDKDREEVETKRKSLNIRVLILRKVCTRLLHDAHAIGVKTLWSGTRRGRIIRRANDTTFRIIVTCTVKMKIQLYVCLYIRI